MSPHAKGMKCATDCRNNSIKAGPQYAGRLPQYQSRVDCAEDFRNKSYLIIDERVAAQALPTIKSSLKLP